MTSKAETTAYFQGLASKANKGGTPPSQHNINNQLRPPQKKDSPTNVADGMLTQATRQQSSTQRSTSRSRRSPSSGATAGATRQAALPSFEEMTPAQIERLRQIRNERTNQSPLNAADYVPLLPKYTLSVPGKKTLVLDVDETLVHSSYRPTHKHDLYLKCKVNGSVCDVYVAYRPFLKDFLNIVKDMFEIVIFTASVEVYCNPLMNNLDPTGQLGRLRLFRDHCSTMNGAFAKDLSLLGRPLDQIAILDNSPQAYIFQPRNAIPILSWFDDPSDTELMQLLPVLEKLAAAPTVYDVLDVYNCTRE